jgi:hypothetical protein
MVSFAEVFDRKRMIVEAMLHIKHKVSKEISVKRVECLF